MAALTASVVLVAALCCLCAPDDSAAAAGDDCSITFMNEIGAPPFPEVFDVCEGDELEIGSRERGGTFIGWFTSSDETGFCPGNIDYRDEPLAVTLTAEGSGTMYARYTQSDLSDLGCVILDPSGGELASCVAGSADDPNRWRSVTLLDPEDALSLPAPVRWGHFFGGWTDGSRYYSAGEQVSGEHLQGGELALTAVWEVETPEILIGDVAPASGFAGERISIVLSANVPGCTASVSGASGFTVTGSGDDYILEGRPRVGQTTLTVTLSKEGFLSDTCTVTISAVERLAFTSSPSIGIIVVR